MKNKKYTYPTSCKVQTESGNVAMNVITQLYSTGIYVAIYVEKNVIPMQTVMQPNKVIKLMQGIKPENLKIENPKITFGRNITVTTDEDGLLVETKQQLTKKETQLCQK